MYLDGKAIAWAVANKYIIMSNDNPWTGQYEAYEFLYEVYNGKRPPTKETKPR